MKKWYRHWTIWAAIVAAVAGDALASANRNTIHVNAVGYAAGALMVAAAVLAVVFALQYSRAKKAAREAADAEHAAELREQWAQKQADAAAAKAARETAEAAHAAELREQWAQKQADAAAAKETAAKAPAKPRAKFERHKVAGTSYHMDAIMALAQENPDYDLTKREIIDDELTDERIYQYTFADGPVELVDDPDSEYDPNAIKVLVAGQHIGYIKRGSTGRVHNLQRAGRVLGVTAEIYGGKYKVVICDDDDNGAERYDLIRDETGYGAAIEILVRPEQEQEPVSTLDT